MGSVFWQHRNGLIDPNTRARLQNGGEAQAQWILSQLYSAFSGVSGKELQNDPLMLMRGSQLAMAKNGQRLRLMDGWLVTQDPQGNYWYLLHGELAGSSFDMQQTHQLITTLNTLEKDLKTRYPQAQLLSRGTVFYSDYASQQAKQDISTGRGYAAGGDIADCGGVPLFTPVAALRDFHRHRRAGGNGRHFIDFR